MSEQVGTPAAPENTPEPPKKSGASKKIVSILGVLVVIAVIAVIKFGASEIWAFVSGDVSKAKVGDCITETVKADASDAKVVDCTKPEAKNKVIGIVPGVSEADFDTKNQELCEEKYPTWQNVIWMGKKGGKGDAWCLEPVKK